MFLSKLFKRKSTKLLTLFGALAMTLGVGAAVSLVATERQSETVETEAAAPTPGKYIYAYNSPNWSPLKAYVWKDGGASDAGWSGASMNRIGTTNTYYLQLNNNPVDSGYNRLIFNNGSKQTKDLTVDYSSVRCFTDFGENSDTLSSGALNEIKLLTSTNGFSSYTTTAFTFSFSSHKYTVSATVDSAGDFDIMVGSAWMNYETVQSHVTAAGVTQTGADVYGKHHFHVPSAGTISISMTPAVNAYGDKFWIFNGSDGTMSFTKAKRTITYQYLNTDGATVKTSTSSTVDVGASVNLPDTPVPSYKFYGWYTGYSAGVFSGTQYNGGASYTVDANITLYGKYVVTNTAYVLGTFNDWNESTSAAMTANSPSTGFYKMTVTLNGESGNEDRFWIRYSNSSANDGEYHRSNLNASGDATSHFISDDEGNFKCTRSGTYDIILDLTEVFIYYSSYVTDTGYYMSGTGTFGTPTNWAINTATKMSSDPSGSNTAILENGSTGTPVSINSKFKVVNHIAVNNNVWYNMTLGGSYSFATIDDNAVKITVAGNYNFYFKATSSTAGTIYIVDTSEILNAGFFYISSPASKANISVTTTNTKDEHPFDGSSLDSVSGVELMSSTLKFNGGFVYEIPIYDLRGADSGSPCKSVTFSWSTPSSGSIALTAVNGSGVGGSAQRYYITGSGAATNSSVASLTEYVALKVAIDIDIAIKGTTHQSVCEVVKGTAESLCSRYDSASKTYMPNATILTWDGDNTVTRGTPVYSGDPVAVRLDSIRVELGNRAGGNYVIASASLIPGGSKGNESPLTTTLWIVLASGLAGLAAIGTAYFVSKKKRSQA